MTMGHNYNRSPTRSPSRFATSTFETTKIVTSNEHIDKISGVVQRVNVNFNLFSKKFFFLHANCTTTVSNMDRKGIKNLTK